MPTCAAGCQAPEDTVRAWQNLLQAELRIQLVIGTESLQQAANAVGRCIQQETQQLGFDRLDLIRVKDTRPYIAAYNVHTAKG